MDSWEPLVLLPWVWNCPIASLRQSDSIKSTQPLLKVKNHTMLSIKDGRAFPRHAINATGDQKCPRKPHPSFSKFWWRILYRSIWTASEWSRRRSSLMRRMRMSRLDRRRRRRSCRSQWQYKDGPREKCTRGVNSMQPFYNCVFLYSRIDRWETRHDGLFTIPPSESHFK